MPRPQAPESPSLCHPPLPPVLPTPSLPLLALVTSNRVAWLHASLVPSSVLASTFSPSAYPRWLALARLPPPLRQLTLDLCGRPGPSTQTSPPCSSQPSRPRMPASTSAWLPAPLAPRRPGSKWSSFQVQGLWGLKVGGSPARALLRPTHSSASTRRCQPPARQD